MPNRDFILTPDILLQAYASGIFPMADSAESQELYWFDPPLRGIIPLNDGFHVPRRLRRTLRQRPFRITFNQAFGEVMRACAAPTDAPRRQKTWINAEILSLYGALHRQGHAHSVEAWDNEDKLVGGLYGVHLGAAFFGESMFSRATDASKISLVYLVSLLRHRGFTLLDTQFQTEHLQQFGTQEIPRTQYRQRLAEALAKDVKLVAPQEREWDVLTLGMLRDAPI